MKSPRITVHIRLLIDQSLFSVSYTLYLLISVRVFLVRGFFFFNWMSGSLSSVSVPISRLQSEQLEYFQIQGTV